MPICWHITRIGYYLGAGQPTAARAVALLCLQVALCFSLAVATLMVLLRDELGHVFTTSKPVAAMVAHIAPLVGGAYALIGIFYTSMATLGGQGRPGIVAIAYLCGAFAIAPVSGYCLSFVVHCCGDTPLYGIWLGLIAGYSVTTLIAGAAVLRSDWPALSLKARVTASSDVLAAPCSNDDGRLASHTEALLLVQPLD